MNLRGLIIATVLLAGLAGSLYFLDRGEDGDEGSEEDKLFAVNSEEIQQITLRPAGGEVLELQRDGETWKIVEPREVVADDSVVSGLLGTLSGLEASDTIEEQPVSLEDYGLEAPQVTVEFLTKPGGTQTLLLGDNTPTGGSVYAKTKDQPRVVTVPSNVRNDFSKTLFDLREKNVLKFDTTSASHAWLRNKSGKLELAKVRGNWRLMAPVEARADQFAANDLLRQVADAKMQAVEAEDGTSKQRRFGLASPEIIFRVQDSSGEHELHVSGEKSGTRYARSPGRATLFTVESRLATQLAKDYSELRNKDVFDMDTWSVSHLEATTPEGRLVLDKEDEQWKGSGSNKAPEASDVTDLLSKLKALQATSFLGAAGLGAAGPASYGLDQPVLRVHAVWADKRLEETVEVGQAGDKAYARREEEPAIYEVEAEALKSAREAVNKLK